MAGRFIRCSMTVPVPIEPVPVLDLREGALVSGGPFSATGAATGIERTTRDPDYV